MEIWLALLIPVAVVLYCIFKYKRKLVWWEIPIPVVATALVILLFNWIGKSSLTKDYEYLGNHIIEVRYYEPWNEYIHQTCSREVPCGTDSDGNTTYCTEYYDCSYVEYHSEKWCAILNDGFSMGISHNYYNSLVSRFGTGKTFVELNRDYYTNDGDMYSTGWDEQYGTYEFVATKHKYKNKVQVASDVFNYPDITEEDIAQYKLYDYPEIDNLSLPAVLSHERTISNDIQKKYDWINGMLGMEKQVRVWVLLFENCGRESASMQEAYWKGGNKNEFVICIGLNGNDINWVQIFSWTEVQSLKVETRKYIEDMETLDLIEIADYLYPEIEEKWVRKEFADFDYLEVSLPMWAVLTTIILSFVVSILLSFFLVKNQHENFKKKKIR